MCKTVHTTARAKPMLVHTVLVLRDLSCDNYSKLSAKYIPISKLFN